MEKSLEGTRPTSHEQKDLHIAWNAYMRCAGMRDPAWQASISPNLHHKHFITLEFACEHWTAYMSDGSHAYQVPERSGKAVQSLRVPQPNARGGCHARYKLPHLRKACRENARGGTPCRPAQVTSSREAFSSMSEAHKPHCIPPLCYPCYYACSPCANIARGFDVPRTINTVDPS